MKNKLLNYIHSTRYKVNERWSWYKRYFYSKWSIPLGTMFQIIGLVLKIFVLTGSFLGIVVFSETVVFSKQCLPYINTAFTTEYISKTGLLGSQITLTLICVSLIALVANIEKRYVYGERLINLAFPDKGPLSFKWAMIALFALLLFNTYLMLCNYAIVYIVLVFLITIYLAIIILYCFAGIFLSQGRVKRKLLRKYYRHNKRQLKKSTPIEHYVSIPLDDLRNTTLKHLICNDIPELNENMRLYFNLLRLTLFNKPKLVQEYYTEKSNCQDVIGHIIEISLNMLHKDRSLYGLRTYNALLKNLNYYKIAGSASFAIVSPANCFIDAFSDIKNKTELKDYLDQILQMNNALIEQYYLQTVTDLSYCRLAKFNLIFFHTFGGLYEKTYDIIIKSPILSIDEKDELIEKIRTSVINLYIVSEIVADIDCFRNKVRVRKEKRIFPLDVKGEQIARLYLRMIESNDTNNLQMYRSLGRGHTTAYFAKILAIISVFNMIHKGNKREYVYDLNIEETNVKQLFKDCELLDVSASELELQEYYRFIIAHYTKSEDGKPADGGIYNFSPKFQFEKCIVDNCFIYLFSKIQKGNTFEDISNTQNYELDSKIIAMIQEFV